MTSLDEVKALNYDHHRRMTELHNSRIASGDNTMIELTDAASYRTLLAHVPKDRHQLLELGSSQGGQWSLLREWVLSGGRICGIDLYEPFVSKAQAAGLDIVLGFVEDMNMYPGESFDLVCSRHVMEHLGDVDAGMAEIWRVLKPGGYSAHVTPDMEFDNEPAHLNKWKLAQWVERWEHAGFDVVHAEKHPFHGGESHVVCRRKP